MAITNLIQFNNLGGVIFGGVTTAVVSLPLTLSLGVGTLGGIYGAVCGGFFAALFGGIPTLISEPIGS
jgi:SulP family sulfate permease